VTTLQLILVYVADLVFADPPWMPHPVRLFGIVNTGAERVARRIVHSDSALLAAGALVAAIVSGGVGVGTWLLLNTLGTVSPFMRTLTATYLAYTALSVRGLDRTGKEVVALLRGNRIEEARSSLAMIVGRDTRTLDGPEILRAVIETLAENTSDGVVAPMFYLALGGAPAALSYKAINTLDSMIGYKNNRYFYFGKAAARLDDLANIVPARLTALLVIVAAFILRLPWRKTLRIVLRDAGLQPSPNSGYPEAAYAGALGIRLGGLNFYGGLPSRKPPLGDPAHELTTELYPKAQRLLYVTSGLMLLASIGIAAFVRRLIWHS
jgi:adenosylcobinamide-phosphate synthase